MATGILIVAVASCSSSHRSTPTSAARQAQFEVAVIEHRTSKPCRDAQLIDPAAPSSTACLTVDSPLIHSRDIASTTVERDATGSHWVVGAQLTSAAVSRLRHQTQSMSQQIAVMLNRRVLITPTVNVGTSVTVIEVPVFGTHTDASSVASRILGRAA